MGIHQYRYRHGRGTLTDRSQLQYLSSVFPAQIIASYTDKAAACTVRIVTIQRHHRDAPFYCFVDHLWHLVAFIRFYKNTVYTGGHGDPHKLCPRILLRQMLAQQIHIYILFLSAFKSSAVYGLPEIRFAVFCDHHIIPVIFFSVCYFMKSPHIGTKDYCAYRNDYDSKSHKPNDDPLSLITACSVSSTAHVSPLSRRNPIADSAQYR